MYYEWYSTCSSSDIVCKSVSKFNVKPTPRSTQQYPIWRKPCLWHSQAPRRRTPTTGEISISTLSFTFAPSWASKSRLLDSGSSEPVLGVFFSGLSPSFLSTSKTEKRSVKGETSNTNISSFIPFGLEGLTDCAVSRSTWNYFRAMSKASLSSKDSTLLRNVNGLLYFQHGRTARPFLGRLFCRYLGIFYNAKLVSSVGNHTDRLGWACLGNDLGGTVGLFWML